MVFEEKHHMPWAYDAYEAYEAEFSGGRGERLPPPIRRRPNRPPRPKPARPWPKRCMQRRWRCMKTCWGRSKEKRLSDRLLSNTGGRALARPFVFSLRARHGRKLGGLGAKPPTSGCTKGYRCALLAGNGRTGNRDIRSCILNRPRERGFDGLQTLTAVKAGSACHFFENEKNV